VVAARGRFKLLAGATLAAASLPAARTQLIPLRSLPARAPAPPLHALATAAPDVRGQRLCASTSEPATAEDAVRIDCAIETGSLQGPPPEPTGTLSVVAFNVERGHHSGRQVAELVSGASVPRPDLLLLSEVDRGCTRTGYRDVAREYAQALGMNYAFGVEYVELPRPSGLGGRIAEPCEHGNAILSRFPIEYPRVLRFAANRSWYAPPRDRGRASEPRLGGRMALAATLRVGGRGIPVYSFHLESGLADRNLRAAQAAELAADAASRPSPRILGGDSNAHGYLLDLVLCAGLEPAVPRFEAAGLRDAHRALLPPTRSTHLALVVVDLILTDAPAEESGVGSWTAWGGLSDHLPIWARLRLTS